MDIYAAVTERIIEQMEQGIIPWCKPWISNGKAIYTYLFIYFSNHARREFRHWWSALFHR